MTRADQKHIGGFGNAVFEAFPGPSIHHAMLLLCVHTAAMVALVIVSLPGWLLLALGLCVAASLFHTLAAALLLSDDAVVAMRGAKGVWLLTARDGSLGIGKVKHVLVFSFLVCVDFEVAGQMRRVRLFQDTLSDDAHRRTRAVFGLVTPPWLSNVLGLLSSSEAPWQLCEGM